MRSPARGGRLCRRQCQSEHLRQRRPSACCSWGADDGGCGRDPRRWWCCFGRVAVVAAGPEWTRGRRGVLVRRHPILQQKTRLRTRDCDVSRLSSDQRKNRDGHRDGCWRWFGREIHGRRAQELEGRRCSSVAATGPDFVAGGGCDGARNAPVVGSSPGMRNGCWRMGRPRGRLRPCRSQTRSDGPSSAAVRNPHQWVGRARDDGADLGKPGTPGEPDWRTGLA